MSTSSRTWLGATGLVVVAGALIAAGCGATAKPNVVARKTAASTAIIQYTERSSAPKLGTSIVPPSDVVCTEPGSGEFVVSSVDPRTGAPSRIVYEFPFALKAAQPPTAVRFDLSGHPGLLPGTPVIVDAPVHCGGTSSTSTTGVVVVDGHGSITPRDQPGLPGNVTLTHTGSPRFGSLTVNWARPSNLGSCNSGAPSGYQVTILHRQADGDDWQRRSSVSADGTSSSFHVSTAASQQYAALVSMKSPCGYGAGGQSNVVTSPGTGY